MRENSPAVREINDREVTMDTNLLSRVVHELVVCTTEYFPVAREGGMRCDEVARRVAISTSYFGIVDADPVSRCGLGVYVSTTHPKMTVWRCVEYHHTSTTNSYAPCPSRLDRWTKPKPLPFLGHFLWQSLRDGPHLGAEHQFGVRPSWEMSALPHLP